MCWFLHVLLLLRHSPACVSSEGTANSTSNGSEIQTQVVEFGVGYKRYVTGRAGWLDVVKAALMCTLEQENSLQKKLRLPET
ncbi:hypothetical protein E2C01_022627 [Portunus trituberculatus]|uniref:Secreted protein n=1 Tax=Portunus trituberculatus TaxID=210409 RepID=A0A5B7E7T2_PORTR|nr:hypothetical protein [Portunus trituberculatus]